MGGQGGRVNLWVCRCARRVMAGGGAGGVPPAGFWAAYLPWRADSGPAARICPGGQIAAAPS